jgi:hypothetical protein
LEVTTQPADGLIEGLVEEVDSCIELRFRSTPELLKFLVQRFDIASTGRRKRGIRTNSDRKERLVQGRKITMSITRRGLLRVFLLLTVAGSYICLAYGKGDGSVVRIARNVAWNDFVFQIRFLPDDSSEGSFAREVLIIQKFLKAHETEPRIGIYDLEVFRAIDRSRAQATLGR